MSDTMGILDNQDPYAGQQQGTEQPNAAPAPGPFAGQQFIQLHDSPQEPAAPTPASPQPAAPQPTVGGTPGGIPDQGQGDQPQQGMPSPTEFGQNLGKGLMGALSAAGQKISGAVKSGAQAIASPDQATPQDAMGLGSSAPQIARYVQGADAAPRGVVSALEAKVDPNNTMDQNERTLRTIQAAAADSPDVGWGVMQYYRGAYNTHMAGTAAALAKGSPPDVVAANFNSANSFLPDGNKITAKPGQNGGYDVQVHTLDGETQSYNLTPEQLNEYVHPANKHGAFDNLVRPDTPDQAQKMIEQIQNSAGQPIQQMQASGASPQAPSRPAQQYGGANPTPPQGEQKGAASVGQAGAGFQKPGAPPPKEKAVEDPFAGFDPQDVTRARYQTNGNMPEMLKILEAKESAGAERESKEAQSENRGKGAAEVRAKNPPPLRQGSDTAEARNARNQSTNDRLATQDYERTVTSLQRDLLKEKQINPETEKPYTPDEALQVALKQVKARGMTRPNPQALTQVAGPAQPAQAAQPAQPGQTAQPAQAAPAPQGRAAPIANQQEIRKDPATGQLYIKNAQGQVVPYQPPTQ